VLVEDRIHDTTEAAEKSRPGAPAMARTSDSVISCRSKRSCVARAKHGWPTRASATAAGDEQSSKIRAAREQHRRLRRERAPSDQTSKRVRRRSRTHRGAEDRKLRGLVVLFRCASSAPAPASRPRLGLVQAATVTQPANHLQDSAALVVGDEVTSPRMTRASSSVRRLRSLWIDSMEHSGQPR